MAPEKTVETLTTHSAMFGTIQLPEDQCLMFEQGLLGFSPNQRFAVLPAAPEGVYWLQGVDDGSLVFLAVDPHKFVNGYSFDPGKIEGPAPSIGVDAECAVLTIVTLPNRSGEKATANVQGPVFIDFKARRGWQLVLAESEFGTRFPVDLSLPQNDKPSSSGSKVR